MTQMTATHVRLERPATSSGLTFKLPEPMEAEALLDLAQAVSEYAAHDLPGWTVIAFSPADPKKGTTMNNDKCYLLESRLGKHRRTSCARIWTQRWAWRIPT